MKNKTVSAFVNSSPRLSLLNDYGRAFAGLENASSPELVERVKSLFEYLNEHLGFSDTTEGKANQKCFNILLNSIYPEVVIDLADMVYAQHERLAVILSFDHININLKKNIAESYESLEIINNKMGQLFHQLARAIIESRTLRKDPKVISLLSESYSYYLYQTQNFPWEYSVQAKSLQAYQPVLDVATGLAGFNMIHKWPADFPNLVLTDNDPFIVKGLSHYLELTRKKNVTLVEADFPRDPPQGIKFGSIMANKFLHHLSRLERIEFLKWSFDTILPNGVLEILDTNVEHYIFEKSKQPAFAEKLTVGYRDTLVEIEKDFINTLKSDVESVGFRVTYFNSRDYHDETDAFSQKPGDNLSLKFVGLEISAEKLMSTE